MIVQRVTVRYKPGKVQEALALIKEERNRIKYPYTRYYLPHSDENVIIGEFEFESIEEKDKFWSDFTEDPGAQHFIQKHQAIKIENIGETFDVFIGD